MRYKQKKRRSTPNAKSSKTNGNIDDQIDGKINGDIESKIDDTIEDINGSIIEDNELSNESEEITVVETIEEPKIKYSIDNLVQTIAESDTYFSSLIDLIPAKIYFEGNEEIMDSMQKQKRDFFGDDLDLSKKSKQKRFKLDPNSDKKISEIANNFYNKSNKLNSKQNKSMDNKMNELKKKLNEKITHLRSVRGQKANAKQLRESKKERKKLNSLRASKQKGFSKRQTLETNDYNSEEPKKEKKNKIKSEDSTDGTTSVPKIYNKEGHIVYSKFDLISPARQSFDPNHKNTKKGKLEKLLVKTKKEEQKLSELAAKDAPKAQEIKEKKLWRKAIDLSEGIKVKDKSKLIEKSLNKKKKSKQKSAKKWDERKESLEKNMKSKADKRKKNIDQRKQQRKDKIKRKLKKKGRILDKK